MLVVQVLWSLARKYQALILFLGPKYTPQSEAIRLQIHAVTNHMYRNRLDTLTWVREKELDLAISGQAPKDLYNEHALSKVKGMLNWQNVNKFMFCTPR